MRPIDLILAVVALSMIYLLWRVITGKQRALMKARIARFQKNRPEKAKDASLRRTTSDLKSGLIFRLTKPLPEFKRLGNHLERLEKPLSAKQYALRRLLSFLVILLTLCVIFKKSWLLGLPVAFLLGVWGPLFILKRKIDKLNRAFLTLFPDAIDLIVRGLRSGLPVSESLNLVSQEVPAPVGPTFAMVANIMKLGVPLEKALQETAKKLDLSEFNFFTTSILLQRETGGNLSEILNNLAEVLRGRIMMRMKIKAMSSEARASMMIIGALPFVVMAAVMLVSPHYMDPMFNDARGNLWLGIAGGMFLTGIWLMDRMGKFEI